jgi:hypothetical protein
MVLVERMSARSHPALWPGKSNAKNAIKRPRMEVSARASAFYALSLKSQLRRRMACSTCQFQLLPGPQYAERSDPMLIWRSMSDQQAEY